MVYIGMFGFVAKVEVLDNVSAKECTSHWAVKIVEIIRPPIRKICEEEIKVGDSIRLDYGFLFNSKKLAVANAESTKNSLITGRSLLGLCY